jgi:hypothetical protein
VKWITRSHVHVDRVACPWLIRRFVDSEAVFLFVAGTCVTEAAHSESAIPFDVDGVELGHRDGHCSFVSIIEKYGFKDPALLEMAEVINAADTGRMGSNPYAAGMEAVARGYSLRYPDDQENLHHQLEVYDALYAFFRLKTAAGKA